jgi:hypothetical protein
MFFEDTIRSVASTSQFRTSATWLLVISGNKEVRDFLSVCSTVERGTHGYKNLLSSLREQSKKAKKNLLFFLIISSKKIDIKH